MMTDFFSKLVILAPPIIIAITFHEAAHGFVAYLRGDDTAYRLGRVSFNPLRHIDVLGTIIIPGFLLLSHAPFLFGFAKPVPVDFRKLKNPRCDTMLVAGAGPLTNIFLALFSALILAHGSLNTYFIEALKISVYTNVVLAVFNLLPLLPLDGGRILIALLPSGFAKQISGLEKWGMAILVGGFMVLPWILASIGFHFSPLEWLLETPVKWTLKMIDVMIK